MPPKEKKNQVTWPPPLPIGRRNIQFYLGGFIVIIIGYFLMSIGPWDSFWSRTLAPLVLIFGYMVVFPIAIMIKNKKS